MKTLKHNPQRILQGLDNYLFSFIWLPYINMDKTNRKLFRGLDANCVKDKAVNGSLKAYFLSFKS